MKKSVSIFGSFLLGLFISVAVIACAVDDDFRGGNTPQSTYSGGILCSVGALDEGRYIECVNFKYNADGIITEIVRGGDSIIYVSFDKNTIKLTFSPNWAYIFTLKDNVDKYSVQDINRAILDGIHLFCWYD